MYQETFISGLGLTASHRRTIRSGKEYDRFFGPPKGTDPLLSQGASVYDTLDFMADIVSKTASESRSIAAQLKGTGLADTCRKLWNFCYNHIQYKQDSPGEEQLRSPSRTWADRKSGVDCDCFSIFCSSILSNLGIAHSLRICELKNKGYFQHVYVVVPADQRDGNLSGGYITIDPVLDRFNMEAPGITKTHDKMIPVRFLNGADSALSSNSFGTEFDEFSGLGCACDSAGQVADKFVSACATNLRNTRQAIAANPDRLCAIYDVPALLQGIDYALQYEHDPNAFGDALAVVAQREAGFLLLHLGGIEDELLGLDGGLGKGVFSKMAAGVKATVKRAGEKAQDAAKKAVKVAKQAGEKVIQYSPLTIAARAGFLLAMEINMFGIADQIRWGYATPDQLNRFGVSAQEAAKARAALAKVEDMFVRILKGQKDSLKKAILSGKQRLDGLGGGFAGVLGEPATAAATTSAAMAFILKAKDWIAGLKIVPKVKELAEKNPDAVKQAKNKLLNKVFGQRNKTLPTADGKQIIEQPPAQDPMAPPEAQDPMAPPVTQAPPVNTPDTTFSDNPAASYMAQTETPVANNTETTINPDQVFPQNPTAATALPQEKKGNSGLVIGAVLGLGALAFFASKSGKSKSLNGPGKSHSKPKKKAKTTAKPKAQKKGKTKKSAAPKRKYAITIK